MKRNEGVGLSSLVSAALIYGFYGIFVRTVGFELPIFFASWTRAMFTLFLVGVVLFTHKDWKMNDWVDWYWIIARTIFGWGAYVTSYLAFNFNTIGASYFVF